MYLAVGPNRSSRPAILLRQSYRDGAKVKNRTLANLPEEIETLRAALRGDKLVPAAEGMEIVRAAAWTCRRSIGNRPSDRAG